jgi:nicotinamidase-related amidase
MTTCRSSALVVIDMLNRYEHSDADALKRSVRAILPRMHALIARARERSVPIVYVNDNYGDWSAGPEQLCDQALSGPDRELVRPVLPPPGAAFVTKARHSAFYETSLEYLLRSQGIERLILCGQVAEQCVLYSALDAYVRHLQVTVPHDAVAHIHPDLARAALQMMSTNMRAHIAAAETLFATGANSSEAHAQR